MTKKELSVGEVPVTARLVRLNGSNGVKNCRPMGTHEMSAVGAKLTCNSFSLHHG